MKKPQNKESVRLHEDINKRQSSLIIHTLVHIVYLFFFCKSSCKYLWIHLKWQIFEVARRVDEKILGITTKPYFLRCTRVVYVQGVYMLSYAWVVCVQGVYMLSYTWVVCVQGVYMLSYMWVGNVLRCVHVGKSMET
jgi:hypothetical protein